MSEVDGKMYPATKRSGSFCQTSASTNECTTPATIVDILTLLRRLKAARISYRLEQTRDDAIAVQAAVPEERWEIEFLASGEVEVEIFKSTGRLLDAGALDDLFARFAD